MKNTARSPNADAQHCGDSVVSGGSGDGEQHWSGRRRVATHTEAESGISSSVLGVHESQTWWAQMQCTTSVDKYAQVQSGLRNELGGLGSAHGSSMHI